MSVLCYDSLGNPLKRLYQWDVNQTILIVGLPNLPTQFHFCDTCNEIAYVVTPTAAENGYIVAVPNVLLEKDDPIILYSYQETGEDAYRTTYLIHIPVVPRSMPEGYIHGDNIEHYTVATVNARISWLINMITGEQTGDYGAEVVDMRDIDGDGVADYTVAGDALRAVYRKTITDKTLSNEDEPADALSVRSALLYEPVTINTFSITTPSGGIAELGSTVSAVTLAYALNKTLTVPETLTLSDGGEPVSVLDDPSPIELTGLALSSDTTYTLTAADDGSPIHSPASASKAANLKFVNRICYGVAASGTVDSAFVNALANKVLSATKARTITVNPGSGQYIWYCVPTRLGACTFKVGGFDGGFEAAQTVSVTNASGYTENYYVYRSTNDNLGSTSVVVS